MTTTTTDYARTIVVDAPVQNVYEAVATLQGLRGWWTPDVSGSAANGGDIVLAFTEANERIVMHVDATSANAIVRWTCTENTGHPEWIGTQPTFVIRTLDDGHTEIDFRHAGLERALECYDVCERGWDHFLESIAAYAETGRGMPYGSDER
jgi:uncharacterized protein YndB with AHSA1/START domain